MAFVGQKVKFDSEVQRYTVQACNDRFAVLTKPFNAKRTYLYTITDLEESRRGAVDRVFGLTRDVDSHDGAKEQLSDLVAGVEGISRRNTVPLSACEIEQLLVTK